VQYDEMQATPPATHLAGRIVRNEEYLQYAAMTKDEAQRRRPRFAATRQGAFLPGTGTPSCLIEEDRK